MGRPTTSSVPTSRRCASRSLARLLFAAALMVGARGQQAPTLTVERELFQVGGESHCLRYSPDGSLLASGGDRGEVVVMNVEDGTTRVLEASDHWVGGLRFSPDGARLCVAGRDATLWDLDTGALVARAPSGSPRALDWSRDGRHIALVRGNAEAVLVDAATLEQVRAFALPDGTAADAIALAPDGKRLAVGKRSGATYVFDTDTGEPVERLQQPDWVHGLAWLDDGGLLRLGWKGALRGYGAADAELGQTAYSMAAQADGARVLVRTAGAVVAFAGGDEAWRIDGSGPVALHPDGERWVRAANGCIEVRRGREVERTLPGLHRQQPGDAVLTGDGRYAILAGKGLQVFDAATGARLEVRDLPDGGRLMTNPSGLEFALLRDAPDRGGPCELQFWGIDRDGDVAATARLVRSQQVTVDLRAAGPGNDPPRLGPALRWLTYADQCVSLTDPTVAVDLDRILVNGCMPTPDGRHLVARQAIFDSFGGGKGEVTVFALTAGHELLARLRYSAPPCSIDLSPDGGSVAVALRDGVQILSLPELTERHRHPWRWRRAQWLSDRYLLGSLSDDTIEVGDVETGSLVESVRVGSWARRVDHNRDRGLMLVTVQDRALLIRVRIPEVDGR